MKSDEPVLMILMAQNKDITMFPEYLDSFEFGFVFPKIRKEYSNMLRLTVNQSS